MAAAPCVKGNWAKRMAQPMGKLQTFSASFCSNDLYLLPLCIKRSVSNFERWKAWECGRGWWVIRNLKTSRWGSPFWKNLRAESGDLVPRASGARLPLQKRLQTQRQRISGLAASLHFLQSPSLGSQLRMAIPCSPQAIFHDFPWSFDATGVEPRCWDCLVLCSSCPASVVQIAAGRVSFQGCWAKPYPGFRASVESHLHWGFLETSFGLEEMQTKQNPQEVLHHRQAMPNSN